MALIDFTEKGLYCAAGNFFIDPWKPVDKALITHGHSDHSRWGHRQYMSTHASVPIIKHRLGKINIKGVDFNESLNINGVKVSFHPAGHILGSAQIRVEYKGEVWVVSGDYKPEKDNFSEPFELVKCHTFITESTFGLPVFNWKPQQDVFDDIMQWWQDNAANGKTSLISAYSLGKAQRVIQGLSGDLPGKIYTHGAVENMNEVLRSAGHPIRPTTRITKDVKSTDIIGGLIIAPPSALGSSWVKRFKQPVVAMASGWMALRGARRRRAADRGFVLSDHADWNGLNTVIKETEAEKVFVTHGYTELFTQWLQSIGIDADIVSTEYGEEAAEALDKAYEETTA